MSITSETVGSLSDCRTLSGLSGLSYDSMTGSIDLSGRKGLSDCRTSVSLSVGHVCRTVEPGLRKGVSRQRVHSSGLTAAGSLQRVHTSGFTAAGSRWVPQLRVHGVKCEM